MGFLIDLIGPTRPRFLILAPACVLLGLGTVIWSGSPINPVDVVLVFIGAILAHASVNAFNEYFDFKSGLDFRTERTPFSGGTGTLPGEPKLAGPTLAVSWVTIFLTAAIGIYFLITRGMGLLPLGLVGLFLIYAYTPVMTHNRYLCLAAPGLGFGPVMVMGTHFALTGHYSATAFLASLIPFFLVSDLLLLNQFPDVAADKTIGRQHFPINIGRQASSLIYCLFMFSAFFTLGVSVWLGYLPKAALMGLVMAVLALPVCIGAFRYSNNIRKLLPVMAMNVVINIATPVLVAVGLFIQ